MAKTQKKTRIAARSRNVPAPVVPPLDDALLRLFGMSSDSEELWKERDPTNKAMRAVEGMAIRVGGLSQMCWSLSFSEIVKGNRRGKEALHGPYGYLARTLDDIAKGLHKAHEAWWDEIKDN